jgi:hypothetical protein
MLPYTGAGGVYGMGVGAGGGGVGVGLPINIGIYGVGSKGVSTGG